MKKINILIFVVIAITINLRSQPIYNHEGIRLYHTPSAEEIELSKSIKPVIEQTTPPVGQIRPIAEWEPMEAVLIRYPFGIPMQLIKEMADDITVITIVASAAQQNTVTNQYISYGVNITNCDFLIANSDSHWTRDYGPWFMAIDDSEIAMFDFYYNRPWRPNDNQINTPLATKLGLTRYSSPLWLTGGNYMTDGIKQAFSTTLTLTENASYSTQYIHNHLHEYLGVEQFHFISDPIMPYDDIQHIDCWSKLLAPNKVLVAQVPRNNPNYSKFEEAANYFANQISSWGTPFEVYRVYTPGATSLSNPMTAYTNSLILNNKVFVPVNNTLTSDDIAALAVYAEAMPGYQIIPIHYGSWYNTDALHCRTHEIADKCMLYFGHQPLCGEMENVSTITFSTDLYSYCNSDFYSDSVIVYLRVNGGDYQEYPMQFIGDNSWNVDIGELPGGLIEYYLYAADITGRSQSYPFIGEYDPFKFVILEDDPVLTLSETEFVFEIDDVVLNKILTVSNLTNTTVTIESVNNDTMEYSYVTPYPDTEVFEYPLVLLPNETFAFEISPLILTKNNRNRDYNIDILQITTPQEVYEVIIKCSEEFLYNGINVSEIESIKIFPNPFDKTVNIICENENIFECKIYDASGRLITTLPPDTNGSFTWSGQNISQGVYFVHIKTYNNRMIVRKIVKR